MVATVIQMEKITREKFDRFKQVIADQAITWHIPELEKWCDVVRYSVDPERYQRCTGFDRQGMATWENITKRRFDKIVMDSTFIDSRLKTRTCRFCNKDALMGRVIMYHASVELKRSNIVPCCADCIPKWERMIKPLVRNQRLMIWRLQDPSMQLDHCAICTHSGWSTETGDRYCIKQYNDRGGAMVVADFDTCYRFNSREERMEGIKKARDRKQRGVKVRRA